MKKLDLEHPMLPGLEPPKPTKKKVVFDVLRVVNGQVLAILQSKYRRGWPGRYVITIAVKR